MRALLLTTILGSLSAHAAGDATQSECLSYEPAEARLTGTLQRHIFAGPPNYEDIKHGDAPESGFYLHLDIPVCTLAAGDFEGKNGVRLVQLVLDRSGDAGLRSQLGRVVTLSGTLSPAISGHHHAPLLLDKPALESVSQNHRATMPNPPLQRTVKLPPSGRSRDRR